MESRLQLDAATPAPTCMECGKGEARKHVLVEVPEVDIGGDNLIRSVGQSDWEWKGHASTMQSPFYHNPPPLRLDGRTRRLPNRAKESMNHVLLQVANESDK